MSSLAIPRPRRALGVMRRMREGFPILEAGQSSLTTWQDGCGQEAAMWLSFFNHYGWVESSEWANGVKAWALSDKGNLVLEEGERWWEHLSWSQRLYVCFFG
ncbi:hypothetical protein HNQ50_000705 [Silvimonas terrae]|uniref:Uncharacterized protein n=1 Tax=Silvimonas terrae TaxID=300266 RepID=A0A840R9G6_9NEIS|nr:hypothetical protein [Silvimonas terrae]MBB5189995.1 hypothetical protein [Silvimonas terrae]